MEWQHLRAPISRMCGVSITHIKTWKIIQRNYVEWRYLLKKRISNFSREELEDCDYILKTSQLRIWEYRKAKWEERFVPYTSKKQQQLEKEVTLLRLDCFFLGIYREPQELPFQTYIVVFWNRELNLYKKQNLVMGQMKHEMEESSGGANSKWCWIKELEKLPTHKSWEKLIS